DDADGRVVATSDIRPSRQALEALLPHYTGTIEQVPPRYSAIKVEGERADDLARDGEVVELSARPLELQRLQLVNIPDADTAEFQAECVKGTQARALARDIGRELGSCGHIKALRRTSVGSFGE